MDIEKLRQDTHTNDIKIIKPKDGKGLEYLMINHFGSGWRMVDPYHIQFIADNHFKIEDIQYGDRNTGYYVLASRSVL